MILLEVIYFGNKKGREFYIKDYDKERKISKGYAKYLKKKGILVKYKEKYIYKEVKE